MSALIGSENAFISESLLDTNPELRPRSVKLGSGTTLVIGLETILITAVLFISILTWFEVLRSWFDNVFSEKSNYKATWIRVLYAVIVTIIAVFTIAFFGKKAFQN
jgi:hypothetical protein